MPEKEFSIVSLQEEPVYNLKAVVQQTGIKPDTLRAWERRYGLPEPERSGGGHRLYSQRDIHTIKWLLARQREGLSISRAVELWQQLKADGRDPLDASMPVAARALQVPPPGFHGSSLGEMRTAWVSACLAYDEQRAEQVLAEAFALYSPEAVAIELMQKAVSEIGARWYRGDVTVQQEHFCSGLTIRRLEAMVMSAPPPTRPGRILAACPPDEYHVISLLLLSYLLRRRGWEVVYLGANVPAERLETTVRATDPHLVVLAAQQLHTAATLLDVAEVLGREEVPLAYGGLVFNVVPEVRTRIPGHFLGERLDLAPQVVERLMTAPRHGHDVEAVPAPLLRALQQHAEHRSAIEAEVERHLDGVPLTPRHLALANRELALNLQAALRLGNLDYLGSDLDWVADLIDSRGLPPSLLVRYLQAYRDAAALHLGDHSQVVVDWFDRLTAQAGGGKE
ncbi:MAG TPA: MerR family transcriptional regulator [Anaerolineae bacterium]|nr:MerR family transcriptional regulator [Anaerolineae bacterium]